MGWASHDLGHHEEIFVEDCLILLSALGDGGSHVVWELW